MTKQNLADVLFRVAGVLGLMLALVKLPLLFTILQASVDPASGVSACTVAMTHAAFVLVLSVLSLVLLFWGGKLSRFIYREREPGEPCATCTLDAAAFVFWLKLIGVFVLFNALPLLTEAIVGFCSGAGRQIMFLGGPPINHVVKACLQIAFGATLIVGARRLAKLFYPDLFEAAAHK